MGKMGKMGKMDAKKKELEARINALFGEIDLLESQMATDQSELTDQERDELRGIVEGDGYIDAVSYLRKTRNSTLKWADSEMRQLVNTLSD